MQLLNVWNQYVYIIIAIYFFALTVTLYKLNYKLIALVMFLLGVGYSLFFIEAIKTNSVTRHSDATVILLLSACIMLVLTDIKNKSKNKSIK